MHNRNMVDVYKKRRFIIILVSLAVFGLIIFLNTPILIGPTISKNAGSNRTAVGLAADALDKLAVKGRASKTGYSRDQFGAGWAVTGGCDTRNIILNRDLIDVIVGDKCEVTKGILNDPYSGKIILFVRGSDTSGAIQIDHVVALSDAWQKGAQQLSQAQRKGLANDPLELLAVDGPANQQKSDGDAASWLPPNKPFRCQYVARQIAVKQKYSLWVTRSEHDAIEAVLDKCPIEILPNP